MIYLKVRFFGGVYWEEWIALWLISIEDMLCFDKEFPVK